MPVFKAIVKRVRDWKKNAVGSEYTRYYNSAEDMAKSAAGYTRYYGPDFLKLAGWSAVSGLMLGSTAILGGTALTRKGTSGKVGNVAGALLGGAALVQSSENASKAFTRIIVKDRALNEFKRQTGAKSMSDVFKAKRESTKTTVDKSAKELVYNHFEK